MAHCSLVNILVALMQMLLPMYHFASPGAVHALPCVNAQAFQTLCQERLSIAAGHGFLGKLLGI